MITAPGWTLHLNASLQHLNTFGVAATAERLLAVHDTRELPQALAAIDNAAPLALGQGSNVLVCANPAQPVLTFTNDDIQVLEHRSEYTLVRAGAGVVWHTLVVWSLNQGFSGLENLALIPGTVGAAPIQNIGAYGAQVGEFIHAVEAWDREANTWVRLDHAACGFAYRDSVFKHTPERYLITAVEFKLPLLYPLRLDYAGIDDQLRAMGIEHPSAADVANAVIAIRQRKLPDPAVMGNAGSFFKNALVPAAQADALADAHPGLPVFAGDTSDQRKLSTAWMIEACGWKGFRDGDAGVAPSHALVLVNHGQASGAQLLTLARNIAESVHTRFGVAIEPEPRLIGATW